MNERKNKSKATHVKEFSVGGEGTRIHKLLAQGGFGSRREIEKAIVEKKIYVNNQLAELGQLVNLKDKIIFNGKPVFLNKETVLPRILIYHKPEGELVTQHDPDGRPTVYKNLPKIRQAKWISIGRLDFNTSGLLIFTSSGELANKLMHPRFEVIREYSVRILGTLTDVQMDLLKQGIELDDGQAKLDSVQYEGGEGANKWYRVTIKEGRNREVRRIFEYFNLTVSRLIRIRFGDIMLPSYLKRGMYEELAQKHVIEILKEHQIETANFKIPQISNSRKKINS